MFLIFLNKIHNCYDNKKTFKPKAFDEKKKKKHDKMNNLEKRLSGHVRPGPAGPPSTPEHSWL